MQYVLGNMLNGAGGLNPDGLSLDLQFAADKTLTARKGPTPVFTRGSTGTFVGSNGLVQSAAVNAARFDHDPVTLASRGLLIEESRTNICLQSENFGTTWAFTNATASLDVATAPDGSTSADKLINNSGAAGRVQQVFTLSGSNVYSVFAKADEWNWLLISPLGGGTGAWFNLSNGTVGTQLSGSVGSITSFGNGWYRCSVVFTGTGVSNSARISPTNANNTLTDGNGTSGILIWGAQLEAGSFATSYIPTVASSVVRSADVCSITGGNFTSFYNQSEGTMLTDSIPAAVAGVTIISGFSNGTSNERWLNRFAQNEQTVITSAGTESGLDALNPVARQQYKVAIAAKLNDVAMSINGSSVVTDSSQPMPIVTRMGIGNSTGTNVGGGMTITSIRYYKKRLSNAKLQALTA
jgi:hypothetical protein